MCLKFFCCHLLPAACPPPPAVGACSAGREADPNLRHSSWVLQLKAHTAGPALHGSPAGAGAAGAALRPREVPRRRGPRPHPLRPAGRAPRGPAGCHGGPGDRPDATAAGLSALWDRGPQCGAGRLGSLTFYLAASLLSHLQVVKSLEGGGLPFFCDNGARLSPLGNSPLIHLCIHTHIYINSIWTTAQTSILRDRMPK
jgi:hypothetical protein